MVKEKVHVNLASSGMLFGEKEAAGMTKSLLAPPFVVVAPPGVVDDEVDRSGGIGGSLLLNCRALSLR